MDSVQRCVIERPEKEVQPYRPVAGMSRAQIAMLVVGQEVHMQLYGPFIYKVKVVKITDDEVEVQSPSLRLYQFDKDGVETSDSRCQRIVSTDIPEECFTGDWHLFPECEPMHIVEMLQ